MAESKIVEEKNDDNNENRPELLPLDVSYLLAAESAPVTIVPIHKTQENHESIVFIWLDPQEQPSVNLVGPLRAINDSVHPFTHTAPCLKMIESSKEKIFFITTSSNSELINRVHSFDAVVAIFIFAPNIESIKGDFPKLTGIFNQQEELFRVLKEVSDAFEQLELELFEFEEDKGFLWSQLWKVDVCYEEFCIFSFD